MPSETGHFRPKPRFSRFRGYPADRTAKKPATRLTEPTRQPKISAPMKPKARFKLFGRFIK
jgi:hypothetical protein